MATFFERMVVRSSPLSLPVPSPEWPIVTAALEREKSGSHAEALGRIAAVSVVATATGALPEGRELTEVVERFADAAVPPFTNSEYRAFRDAFVLMVQDINVGAHGIGEKS